ncbi:MAG TPA: SRPBCC family protein [Cyclobacteriaceae bacterium]|nr:SRPBCC family protein [Cyclobacteriaceae bacterium]
MKTIKVIFIVVGVIILIPLVMAVFITREYDVEREIVINKPKTEVYDFVRYLKNQDRYNKWVIMDPAMKKDFSGTDGAVGCVYSWDGDKAGKGEQELTNVVDGDLVEAELRFIKPFEGVAHTHMITEEVAPDQTKVTWGMKGANQYPMNFMNLFMNNMLGADLDESLSTLKEVMEKGQASLK